MLSQSKMLQLSGSSTEVETTLDGPSRIYSRKDTAKIIELARSAQGMRGLLALGRYVMEATKTQDSAPPEYTDGE